MKTVVRQADGKTIGEAAALLQQGSVVAFPTETVYGLGGNALDPRAVKKIFVAKKRPSDNPLIVHISDEVMLAKVVQRVSPKARKLIRAFWPGPLTILFPAKKSVPSIVRAGLPTVAVRMPSNIVARDLILAAGVPLAAPSANTSGRPSPTTAAHVLADLNGRIPLIIDGGPCTVGVESTVVDISKTPAIMLRPGAITLEKLERILGKVMLATEKTKVRAPGMKYTHYAPNAKIVLVQNATQKNLLIVRKSFSGRVKVFDTKKLTNKNLYATLRNADEKKYDVLIIPVVSEKGDGAALMNRLRKAATQIIDGKTVALK